MQAAMDRLSSFVRRHRVVVAAAWLVLLVAAIPFAARQTENLTSGGFEVPGSGSQAVDRGLADFAQAQRESLAAVVARKPGATDADVRAAIDKIRAATGKVAHVKLTDAAAATAAQHAGRAPITVAPLQISGSQDDAANAAADLRRDLKLGRGGENLGHVEIHLVGQQALWAGMQDLSKEDLAQAE